MGIVLTQSNTFIIGSIAKLLGFIMNGIFNAPYFSIASSPYWEQVGKYLQQLAVFSPDKYFL